MPRHGQRETHLESKEYFLFWQLKLRGRFELFAKTGLWDGLRRFQRPAARLPDRTMLAEETIVGPRLFYSGKR